MPASLVGMTGFEPATSRPPDVHSNRAELHPEKRVCVWVWVWVELCVCDLDKTELNAQAANLEKN